MLINFLFYICFMFILNNFFIKKNYLKSDNGFLHQLFVNKSVPLTGGIIIFFPIFYIFFEFQELMIISYFLIFILGTMSDLNILSSSKKRFFLQVLITSFFVIATQLEVLPTRIYFIDEYFQGSVFSFLLTIFCFLVLINGANFIDGLNGLLLGYVTIIFLYLFKLNLVHLIGLNSESLICLLFLFTFVLLLNFNNKLFLGDGGSYSTSFLIGFILIKIYNLNNEISPYFIILLLWYPCFENLFSIFRKFTFKLNPLNPDNMHLHHYLFIYLKKKFHKSDLITNNLASIVINIFNCFIFYFGSINLNSSKIQLGLIIFCVIFYILIYMSLRNKHKLFKE